MPQIDIKKKWLFVRVVEPDKFVRFFWQKSKYPQVAKVMGVTADNKIEMQALRIHRSVAKKIGPYELSISGHDVAHEIFRLLKGRGLNVYRINIDNKKEFSKIKEFSGESSDQHTTKKGRGWFRQSKLHSDAAILGLRRRASKLGKMFMKLGK